MSYTDQVLAWVDAAIDKVCQPAPAYTVTPSRYPYTYAYDLIRRDPSAFGFSNAEDIRGSRASASGALRNRLGCESQDELHFRVCIRLADAYIASENLVWPEGITPAQAAKDSVDTNWSTTPPVSRPAWVNELFAV